MNCALLPSLTPAHSQLIVDPEERRCSAGNSVSMRLRYLFPILALSILLPVFVQAREPFRTVEGVVRHVADGDTVTAVISKDTALKIRFYGVNASDTEKVTAEPALYQSLGNHMERKSTERTS